MAAIALILSLAFTILVWWVDVKRKGELAWAALIPFTWFAIALSRNISRWFGFESPITTASVTGLMEEGNLIDRVVFGALLFLGILVLIRRRRAVIAIIIENPFFALLYLYCACSIAWSDFAYISLKRLIKDIACPVALLVLSTEKYPIDVFKTMIRRIIYLLAPLSVVLIKYFPQIGRAHTVSGDYISIGVTTHKNPLGILCLIGSLIFIIDLISVHKEKCYDKIEVAIHIATLMILFYLLALANSMTNSICLVICVVIMLSPSLQKNIIKLLVAVALLYFCATNELIAQFYNAVGRNATLTGRTGAWETLLAMQPTPLFGTGYGAFWHGNRLEELWRLFANHPKQAHNGYIETYLNLGIFGLLILIVALGSAYKKIMSHRYEIGGYHAFRVGFLTIFLVYNITEANFLTTSPLWFIFLFITVCHGIFTPEPCSTTGEMRAHY